MSSSFEIRSECAEDILGIRAVVAASFPTDAEARLVDTLRTAGDLSISLVAVEAGRVIGHIGFSPVTLNATVIGMGLAPVAVEERSRRRGVASRLVQAGVEHCRHLNHRYVVVLGVPAFYAKFGFRPASVWGFRDEYGGGEAFQAIDLAPQEPPSWCGTVRYAPAFSMFS
ncbi:MAG: N-acetyltransferase [Planctomycetaceae bacterium]|nr:N-acetyltransferase [Planctomycetaceae bacterium]